MSKRLMALAAGVTLTASAVVIGAGSATAADTATVTVVHGVPGLTVDVYANDQPLLKDFTPGTVADPLTIPAGDYDIEVFPAGSGPDGTAAIQKNVSVPAGANASVVAHYDAAKSPVLTAFVNDTATVAAGKARVTVRHVAAAPAVDVRAGGAVVFSNLTNPNEAKADVAAGTLSVDVVPTGATEPVVLGPASLDLTAGTNTIVYAWGSLDDDNLAVASQTITGLGAAPSGVPSGTGGLADEGGFPIWAGALMAAAAVGVAASGSRLARSRA